MRPWLASLAGHLRRTLVLVAVACAAGNAGTAYGGSDSTAFGVGLRLVVSCQVDRDIVTSSRNPQPKAKGVDCAGRQAHSVSQHVEVPEPAVKTLLPGSGAVQVYTLTL